MTKRLSGVVLLIGLLGLVFVPTTAFASASASAVAKGGEDCGEISKQHDQNPGAMTVLSVTVNGGDPLKKGVDYTVTNDGSSQPKINFTNALVAKDKVDVKLTTIKRRNFVVNLTLSDC